MCCGPADSRRDWEFAAEETGAGIAPLPGITFLGIPFMDVLLIGGAPTFCEGATIEDRDDAGVAEFCVFALAVF